MTNWYVQGSGGNDNNGGTSWAVRSTGTDGATHGNNTLDAASASWSAADIGHGIFIGGVNQWRLIVTVPSATQLTFSGATIATASGRTWTVGGRFATVSKALGIAGLAAGDTIYVAPGTYKETCTLSVSGGSLYTTGTVSLTNGSATVTGSSTLWLANATAVNGFFHQSVLASGTDGVANGTTTFTSSAGNFQSGMVGKFIQVAGKAAYQITAVGSATSITLSGSPTAGSGLTYAVESGEGSYQIASVDNDTQITLSRVWDGPTVTGVAYRTYQAIVIVGDYLGTNTDGVGGLVRLSGAAANEQTTSRNNAVTATSISYNVLRGFCCDSTTQYSINLSACLDITVEQCALIGQQSAGFSSVSCAGAGQARLSIRRCLLTGAAGAGGSSVIFTHTTIIDEAWHSISNCIFLGAGGSENVRIVRVFGNTVTNCFFYGGNSSVRIATSGNTGYCQAIYNSRIIGCTTGILAAATSEIMEDYNNIYGCGTARTSTGTGAHSLAYPDMVNPIWFMQMLFLGAGPSSATQVISPYDFPAWDALIDVAGLYPRATDIRGTGAINSVRDWGALEYDSTLKIQGGGTGGIAQLVAGGMVVS